MNLKAVHSFILSAEQPIALAVPLSFLSELEGYFRALAEAGGVFLRTVDCNSERPGGELCVDEKYILETLREEASALYHLPAGSVLSPLTLRRWCALLNAEGALLRNAQLERILQFSELLESHERGSPLQGAAELILKDCNPHKVELAVKLQAKSSSGRGRPVIFIVRAREAARQLLGYSPPRDTRLLLRWELPYLPRPCEAGIVAPRELLQRAWSTEYGLHVKVELGGGLVAAGCW